MKPALVHRSFIALTAFLLMLAPAAMAQISGADCSELVVGRSYAYQFSGFVNFGPGTIQYPNAGAGSLVFLPDGKLTGTFYMTVGPLKPMSGIRDVAKSTYSLAWTNAEGRPPVCWGSITADTSHFQVLVTDDGARLEVMHNDAGLTLGFTAYAMPATPCSNETLNGVYTYIIRGWLTPPPNFPPVGSRQMVSGLVPVASGGSVHYRPYASPPVGMSAPPDSAMVTGADFVSLDGLLMPRTLIGWYKVEADCSMTTYFRDDIGNPLLTTRGFIFNSGGGVQTVNTDTGIVLAFTATKAAEIH